MDVRRPVRSSHIWRRLSIKSAFPFRFPRKDYVRFPSPLHYGYGPPRTLRSAQQGVPVPRRHVCPRAPVIVVDTLSYAQFLRPLRADYTSPKYAVCAFQQRFRLRSVADCLKAVRSRVELSGRSCDPAGQNYAPVFGEFGRPSGKRASKTPFHIGKRYGAHPPDVGNKPTSREMECPCPYATASRENTAPQSPTNTLR